MTLSTPAPTTNATSDDTIIETIELTKVYEGADFRAVDALDLTVHRGEIFGLLGPNGAGKTTTAGMLTTRVIPTSGVARVAGVDVVAPPRPRQAGRRRRLPDQHPRPPAQRVGEPVLPRPAVRHRRRASRAGTADELLEQFQLSKWAKASVYALSGGMAQRLMVARSIFHRPAVLFMDEPTAGLDPQSRLALWDILRDLHGRGPDDPAHDALHGGGRPAVRSRGDHGPRQDPRPRHARRASSGASGSTRSSPSRRAATRSASPRRSTAALDGVTRTRPTDHGARAARPGQRPPARSHRRGRRGRPASTSRTSRWPSRPSRPSSSTSPARSSATDGDDGRPRPTSEAPSRSTARRARRSPRAAPPSARCSCATSSCCARTSGSSRCAP